MNVQDKLERILRELHIMASRAPAAEEKDGYVLISKKEMQKQLGNLSQAVREMMDEYEVTQQSRNRGELEAENQRLEIIRSANHQAQDIYAASVIYSEDALGRIQDIIQEAERSSREILKRLGQQMEEERRVIRSNQLELITQLEDMKDTAKYMKLIEERNREIAKEKEKKKEKEKEKDKSRGYQRKTEKDPEFQAVTPEIKINEEYFEKAGLTPEGLPKDMMRTEEKTEEKTSYEKPVIKVNKEYFKKAGIKLEDEEEEADAEISVEEEEKKESREEKRSGFFLFGKRP